MSDKEQTILHFKSCTGTGDSPLPLSETCIHFNILNEAEDSSVSITLANNDTVGHVKAAIFKKWKIPTSQQVILGWSASSDHQTLKDLDLSPIVQLRVETETSPASHKNAPNDVNNSDFGGYRKQISLVKNIITSKLEMNKVLESLDVIPGKGILLHGPSGCGKTTIARMLANQMNVFFIEINVSEYSDLSVVNLRKTFEKAELHSPSIIFIDDFDLIAMKRNLVVDASERKVICQLISSIDSIKNDSRVIVIAATNSLHIIDCAFRRGDRFSKEIEIGLPDYSDRLSILRIYTKNMKIADDVDLDEIASNTHGYTGADLANLCSDAVCLQISKDFDLINFQKCNDDANVFNFSTVIMADFKSVMNQRSRNAIHDNVISDKLMTVKTDIQSIKEEYSELREIISMYCESANETIGTLCAKVNEVENELADLQASIYVKNVLQLMLQRIDNVKTADQYCNLLGDREKISDPEKAFEKFQTDVQTLRSLDKKLDNFIYADRH